MNGLTRRDYLQLLMALSLALAARCYKLGYASLWLDEAETVRFSSLPLSVLWVTPYDHSPPLYYSIIHFLLEFGHSETLLRLPSVFFGVLSIAVVYLATRKIGGSLAAFAAALLLSLSFHSIEYAQEARAYSLLGLCLSVSLFGLISLALRWTDASTDFTFREFLRCGGGLYALGLIAALYTHNTTVFYWLGVQFFFLAWWVRAFRCSLPCLISWGAVNLAVLLLWMPWLLASLQMIEKGTFSWLRQASPEAAFATWRAIHGFREAGAVQAYTELLLVFTAIAGVYSLRRNVALVTLLLSLLILSSIATWAYGLVATPVFMLRTILWTSLSSVIVAGIGISRLPKTLGAFLLMLFLASQARGVYHYYNVNFAETESWRALAAIFNENQKPNDILLIRQPYVSGAFFYYVEQNSADWDIYGWQCTRNEARSGVITEIDSIMMVDWRPSDLGPGNPIPMKAGSNLWVIQSHCLPGSRAETDALFFPYWRLKKTYEFRGAYLQLWCPASSGAQHIPSNGKSDRLDCQNARPLFQ